MKFTHLKFGIAMKLFIAVSIVTLAMFACKVEDAAKTWTVTINLNGGTGLNTSYQVEDGNTANLAKPSKSGYEFVGWTSKADGTSADFDASNTAITSDISLYAIWKLLPLADRITFTKDFATLHSFQYQIEIQLLESDVNLEFIASSDSTAPAYSAIENDEAKRSAYFTPSTAKRGVYFSFKSGGTFRINKYPILTETNDYNATTKNYIDLKNKNSQGAVQQAIEAISPALFSPGGTYYIHVYKDGAFLKTSSAITLPYYPQTWKSPVSALTAFNSDDYLLSEKIANKTIEVNEGDDVAIPFSYIFPASDPPTACGTDPSLSLYRADGGLGINIFYTPAYPMHNTSSIIGLLVAFAPPTTFGTNYTNSSASDKYYVYDIFYIYTSMQAQYYDNQKIYWGFGCNSTDPNNPQNPITLFANSFASSNQVTTRVYPK